MMIVRVLLIGILFFGVLSPLFAFSQTISSNSQTTAEIDALNKKISERKDRIRQLEESMEEYKKKIEQKRLEGVSLSNQVVILDARVNQAKLDLNATETKIDAASLEIESLGLSIADKEKTIAREKRMMAELLRTMHRHNETNVVEMLAAYDNFSDFYNRLQYLERVDKDIGKSVKTIRAAKADLEQKTAQASERKSAYESLKEELSQKKKDLEESVFTKQDILAKTKASEKTYQTLLASLKRQYQETENEIVNIERDVRRRLEAQNKIPDALPDTQGLFQWPTQSRYITAGFHDPEYPFRNVFEHNAIDIRASQGTAVRAAASGYVARAKRCGTSSCYSYVMIVHTESLSTVYGHLSQVAVSEDQFVTRGDVIGYSGGTPGTVGAGPFVTGPHLHFEVRQNGIPVDPLGYLVRE